MVIVSGTISGVSVIFPTQGENVSDTILVNWTNAGSIPGLYLQYNEEGAGTWNDLTGPLASNITTHSWDTTGVIDGNYSLRLIVDGNSTLSGSFTIDNTNPTAEANGAYSQILYKDITFNATGSNDGNGTEIINYTWDFGDGVIETTTSLTKTHSYNTSGSYTATLTVIDYAGNSGTDTASVTISDFPTTSVDDQEVLAFDSMHYNFSSGLENLVNCDLITPTDKGIVNGTVNNNCSIDWTPTNDYRGEHNIIIKAVNTTSDEKYYSFKITVYSWMIELQVGWNLVSIPLVPEDSDYQEVLDGIRANLSKVWSYEYDKGTGTSSWHGRKTTTSGWSTTYWGDLDDIVPGRSYWLEMDDLDVLKGFGGKIYDNPTGESSPAGIPEITLPTNSWSLIGRYGLYNKTINNSTALQSLTGSMTLINSTTDIITDLTSGEGYWMWIKNYDIDEETYTPLDNYYYLN